MQDFNSYVNSQNSKEQDAMKGMDKNLYNLVKSLASKFDGKNQSELIKAVYSEAKKGKQNGTLTNSEIDNFARMLSPLLDDKKRKMLNKIIEELKKI